MATSGENRETLSEEDWRLPWAMASLARLIQNRPASCLHRKFGDPTSTGVFLLAQLSTSAQNLSPPTPPPPPPPQSHGMESVRPFDFFPYDSFYVCWHRWSLVLVPDSSKICFSHSFCLFYVARDWSRSEKMEMVESVSFHSWGNHVRAWNMAALQAPGKG